MTCPGCETRNLIALDRNGVTVARCGHDDGDDRDEPPERRRQSIWDIFG